MRRCFVGIGALAGLLVSGGALEAQQAARAGSIAFQATPYAGYMLFGDLVKGPVGTSISPASGPLYGVQLGARLTPNIALVSNIGRANGTLQVGLPYIGGLPIGKTEAWVYDAGIQLGAPMQSVSGLVFAPFIEVGAGAMRYDVDVSLVRLQATNLTFNAGLGADVDLIPGLSLRFVAKDYIGRFDVREAMGLDLLEQATGMDLDLKGATSHNFGITAGVKLEF